MAEPKKYDPSDPWSFDAFNPDVPKVDFQPAKKTPRMFPEEDRLFSAQKHALNAHNAALELERSLRGRDLGVHGDRALRDVLEDTENAYRVIRSYLDKYVAPPTSL